jgi:hypothetical protein
MTFVIAKKNCEYLDTPVFHAGPQGKEEAVAVFTSRQLAERYIDDASWSEEYEVGELEPIQLARWVVTANENGTDMLVVDPNCDEHLRGERQNVVFLGNPLTAFADILEGEIKKLEQKTTPSELLEAIDEASEQATPSRLAEAVQEGS